MSNNRAEREKHKQIQDKCQAILGQLLREEDNKYCVDCDAKGPRWASWNLGIFLCIRCAGIHRNLGVHISKVKSVNLDTWTPEQIACLQQMGNSKARAVYEANLPDNFRRPQTDSSLEAFIRAKYEQKKYIAKEWVPPPAPKPAFDIEEERKKEKEKRKTKKASGSSTVVEIPMIQQPAVALPRPHSSGSNVSSVPIPQEKYENSQTPPPQQPKQNSSTVDLLSLDAPSSNQSEEDPFDSFLSATPVSCSKTSASADNAVSSNSSHPSQSVDEANFFNQTADAPKKSPLTKESILSLYGAGSSQAQPPPQQQQPPIYGVPGGVYIGQPVYAPAAACLPGMIPATMPAVPNGVAGVIPQGINLNIQLQQRMANLQLGGQSWNIPSAGVIGQPTQPGVVLGAQPIPGATWPVGPHGQTLSTNLWQ